MIQSTLSERIGAYFIDKWRKRAADSGHFNAATALRKQGVPLETARLILFGTKAERVANFQLECLTAMAERQYFGFAVH